MLKVVPVQDALGNPVLRLAGQVIGPWVDELRRACHGTLGGILTLDLEDVSFADPAGVELLRALHDRGARLVNCSAFVAEQLKAGGCVR
ncbi:MAG: hypothetical protein ACE147_06985 [Candidatus Methylomirabilales bacterium]